MCLRYCDSTHVGHGDSTYVGHGCSTVAVLLQASAALLAPVCSLARPRRIRERGRVIIQIDRVRDGLRHRVEQSMVIHDANLELGL